MAFFPLPLVIAFLNTTRRKKLFIFTVAFKAKTVIEHGVNLR